MITLAYLFTSVGRPKHIRVMAGALEGDIFIGPKAEVGRMINMNVLPRSTRNTNSGTEN